MPATCAHESVRLVSSPHAAQAGYKDLTASFEPESRARKSKSAKDSQNCLIAVAATSFPAPLVLPDDELALDPQYPPQSLRGWLLLKDRNKVTLERRTIYVAAPPRVAPDISPASEWTKFKGRSSKSNPTVDSPNIQEVVDYLNSFYHGLPVKQLNSKLTFTAWENKRASKTQYIGLETTTERVGIRTRKPVDDVFARQLNLNDLLDVAISVLPEDAYALLLVVEHDLYEDDDDDFACGRAYGGSRVAVVSTARYHPDLDRRQSVERLHAWPASHCNDYVQKCCTVSPLPKIRKRGRPDSLQTESTRVSLLDTTARVSSTPIEAALTAYRNLPQLDVDASTASLSGLWLSRVCRTASHELGHCLGIDHCVYYACCMQGTASLSEDGRQPPYLCPIDLAKLLRATGSGVAERYLALLAFCERYEEAHMFAAFAAWIRGRLVEMGEKHKTSRIEDFSNPP